MNSIIRVNQPVFWINLKNPQSIEYEMKDIKDDEFPDWIFVAVEDFKNGFPRPKENQILYIYTKSKGYLFEQENNNADNTAFKFYDKKNEPADMAKRNIKSI